MNLEIATGSVTKTTTGVEGALDIEVTVTIPAHTVTAKADPNEDDCLTAAAQEYFTEHPWLKDHFYGKADGYTYLAPRWEDEDNRETVVLDIPARDVEGEVTLAPHEYDERWAMLGDSPACWVSGKLLDALYAAETAIEGQMSRSSRAFRGWLTAIETEAAEACNSYENP